MQDRNQTATDETENGSENSDATEVVLTFDPEKTLPSQPMGETPAEAAHGTVSCAVCGTSGVLAYAAYEGAEHETDGAVTFRTLCDPCASVETDEMYGSEEHAVYDELVAELEDLRERTDPDVFAGAVTSYAEFAQNQDQADDETDDDTDRDGDKELVTDGGHDCDPTDDPLAYEVTETTRKGSWGQEITKQKLRATKSYDEMTEKEMELDMKVNKKRDVPDDAEAGDIVALEDIVGDTRTREEKDEDALEEAAESGDEIVISKTTTDCNDSSKECNLDHVTRVAKPNGEIETRRTHTY